MSERSDSAAPSGPREVREVAAMTALTVVAGAVDAIGFLTMGQVFTALATGNLVFLSFALVGEGRVPVVRPAVALIGFVLGAAAASLPAARLVARGRRWFPAALAAEAALLATAGVVALVRHGTGSLAHDSDLPAVSIVGFAMGMRATSTMRAAVPGMPTLLIQSSLVRLVDDLVAGARVTSEARSARRRLDRVRLAATVGGMFTGGVLGTLMVPWGTGRALLAVAAAVLLLAALHALLSRYRPPVSPGAAG
ncbi:YoaK family protein [Streptomyces macrosporus]|uniref:YoaK family protein n=1 Tax=Streptomyces macrosporus TaxID=44032 RepID=A0ABP5X772_9ACTN